MSTEFEISATVSASADLTASAASASTAKLSPILTQCLDLLKQLSVEEVNHLQTEAAKHMAKLLKAHAAKSAKAKEAKPSAALAENRAWVNWVSADVALHGWPQFSSTTKKDGVETTTDFEASVTADGKFVFPSTKKPINAAQLASLAKWSKTNRVSLYEAFKRSDECKNAVEDATKKAAEKSATSSSAASASSSDSAKAAKKAEREAAKAAKDAERLAKQAKAQEELEAKLAALKAANTSGQVLKKSPVQKAKDAPAAPAAPAAAVAAAASDSPAAPKKKVSLKSAAAKPVVWVPPTNPKAFLPWTDPVTKIKYHRNSANVLLDEEENPIGVYNEETGEIEPQEFEMDEDDE